jgi:hypothetical protein
MPPKNRISRLYKGTLTLGDATASDLSCQITNTVIKHAYADDGDTLTLLCGEVVNPNRKSDGTTLEGTIVQDFDYPESDGGVVDYIWNHELEEVPFTFTPNQDGAPTYTGNVVLEIPDTGGDAGGQLTADFVWTANSIEKDYPVTP